MLLRQRDAIAILFHIGAHAAKKRAVNIPMARSAIGKALAIVLRLFLHFLFVAGDAQSMQGIHISCCIPICPVFRRTDNAFGRCRFLMARSASLGCFAAFNPIAGCMTSIAPGITVMPGNVSGMIEDVSC